MITAAPSSTSKSVKAPLVIKRPVATFDDDESDDDNEDVDVIISRLAIFCLTSTLL